MIQEFKEFILRGNVLELAVAVIIAGAFGLVIGSFINDVLMPPIGMFLGGVDFAELKYVLQEGVVGADGEVVTAEVAVMYGKFINTIINFIIVAFVIFMVVKAYNKTQKPEEEAPAGPSSEDLLTEIRDLLARNRA